MIEVTTDPAAIDLDCVYRWLKDETYWAATMPREVFERAVGSSLAFGALAHGETVGFARVVTDRATFAYLTDVFVAPDWRRRGVAAALVAAVVAHPDLQYLRRTVLVTRDSHALYERFGFRPLAAPGEYMERFANSGLDPT